MFGSLAEHNKKSIIVANNKKPLLSRYFIELHVPANATTSRPILDQMRRQQALEFTQLVGEWLKENGMTEEVSSLSVTAMGQVMIVCGQRVIDTIREQDIWAIAHIRSSDQFSKLSRSTKGN